MRSRIAASIILATLLAGCGDRPGPASGHRSAPGAATDPKATDVIHDLSDYFAGLKGFSVKVASEAAYSGQGGLHIYALTSSVAVERPNKLSFVAEAADGGGGTLTCDGSNVYAYLPLRKKVTVTPAPPDFERLFQGLGESMRMVTYIPELNALIQGNAYASLMAKVKTERYLGTEEIRGATCHHLAFSEEDQDWEMWVEVGDTPLLRKIRRGEPSAAQAQTDKTARDEGNMVVTRTFDEWEIDPVFDKGVFEFEAPPGTAR